MSAGPILVMAGGTGGHVFPALAVARALRDRACEVVWLGTRGGLEAHVVPEAGFSIDWLAVGGLRGKGLGTWLLAPVRLLIAFVQAVVVMLRRRPAAVLGMGGFVSGPGGLAAWVLRRPLVIHEQNAIAGLSNRLLARLASEVLEAFPASFPHAVRARRIGNPVRAEIFAVPEPGVRFASRDGRPRLLVLGGSQGALVLNRTVPPALAQLEAGAVPEVWHQAGRAKVSEARSAYADAGVDARIVEFIDDMPRAYAWADLVVCRAGALTIAELAASGLGAILVPYPYAVDDHQSRNAAVLVEAGAAVLIPESVLSADTLAEHLVALLPHRAELLAMAKRARALGAPRATMDLAEACLAAAGSQAVHR